MNKLIKQRPTKKIPTAVMVTCPSCKKPRLVKYRNDDDSVEPVSDETAVSVTGEERYVDICVFCQRKFSKRDELHIKKQAKQLLRAMQNKPDVDGIENIEL